MNLSEVVLKVHGVVTDKRAFLTVQVDFWDR